MVQYASCKGKKVIEKIYIPPDKATLQKAYDNDPAATPQIAAANDFEIISGTPPNTGMLRLGAGVAYLQASIPGQNASVIAEFDRAEMNHSGNNQNLVAVDDTGVYFQRTNWGGSKYYFPPSGPTLIGQTLVAVSGDVTGATPWQLAWQTPSSGGTNTFSNGLTKTGTTVRLGGNLTQDTTINIGNRKLFFNGAGVANAFIMFDPNLLFDYPDDINAGGAGVPQWAMYRSGSVLKIKST